LAHQTITTKLRALIFLHFRNFNRWNMRAIWWRRQQKSHVRGMCGIFYLERWNPLMDRLHCKIRKLCLGPLQIFFTLEARLKNGWNIGGMRVKRSFPLNQLDEWWVLTTLIMVDGIYTFWISNSMSAIWTANVSLRMGLPVRIESNY